MAAFRPEPARSAVRSAPLALVASAILDQFPATGSAARNLLGLKHVDLTIAKPEVHPAAREPNSTSELPEKLNHEEE